MKKHTLITTAVSALILSFSLNASAAVFIKYEGVKGESRAMSQGVRVASGDLNGDGKARPATPKQIKAPKDNSKGLLLPAVQSAREAAR